MDITKTVASFLFLPWREGQNGTVEDEDIVQNVSYLNIWEVEKLIDFPASVSSIQTNYEVYTLVWIAIISAYLFLTFYGQYLMRTKKPWNLQKLWTCWNFGLAAFSLIGFLRTSPELFDDLRQENGFHQSVCKKEYSSATAFWSVMMFLSKILELGDTVFVVLKKKPLTFLNWGHHACAVIAAFLLGLTMPSVARWGVVMNFFVHAQMYTYFGIRTLNINTPKVVTMIVTSIQTTQMFIGTIVSGYSVYAKLARIQCHIPLWQALACLLAYLTFSLIFAQFFYQNYIKSKSEKPIREKAD